EQKRYEAERHEYVDQAEVRLPHRQATRDVESRAITHAGIEFGQQHGLGTLASWLDPTESQVIGRNGVLKVSRVGGRLVVDRSEVRDVLPEVASNGSISNP